MDCSADGGDDRGTTDQHRSRGGATAGRAETHHRVFRITDGVDEDWASSYGDWLLDLSELSELLGARPVRSHLVHALVQLDRDYAAAGTDEPWPAFYARRLYEQFGQA
jgi:hypothetical protein